MHTEIPPALGKVLAWSLVHRGRKQKEPKEGKSHYHKQLSKKHDASRKRLERSGGLLGAKRASAFPERRKRSLGVRTRIIYLFVY